MVDLPSRVDSYLSLIQSTCMYTINLISTTFRILFWLLFACIIAAILVDIGLYGFRTFASRFGIPLEAGQRQPKTIAIEPDPTEDPVLPPSLHVDLKKER